MKQRQEEWLETPVLSYHERQLQETYRSTVLMCDWLESLGYLDPSSRLSILDLGTGRGANLAYLGKRYPGCKFIGVELNPDHVRHGNSILFDRKVENARIEQGDWYNLDNSYVDVFDGILSFQTLSWLPEFRYPTEIMCKLNPKWLSLSSLFYNGLVSATTETQTWSEDLTEKRKLYYNVYSIPVMKGHLENNGYGNFRCSPFNIDVDIPNTGEFRTYTEKTEDGRRIQISGPVLMPWYFIAAEKRVI
jgi:SAM-dependent methyltransferase